MHPLNIALTQGDFQKVGEILSQDGPLDMSESQKLQAFEELYMKEQYDILSLFIEKKHICLDLYELSSYTSSVYDIFKRGPYSDERKKYILTLFQHTQNIGTQVENMSLLAYYLKSDAPLELIELCVSAGLDVSWRSSKNESLLFYTHNIEKITFLLSQGIDVNIQNTQGDTVLFGAIEKQNTPLIELYLQHGAKCNIQNIQGETPYDRVLFTALSEEIYDKVCSCEAPDFESKNKQGQSLFFRFVTDTAFESENEIQLLVRLLQSGAPLFQEEANMYGEILSPAKILAQKGSNVLQILVGQKDFDIHMQDNQAETWLHYVCAQKTYADQNKVRSMYQKAKILKELGAKIDIKNRADQSPLDLSQDEDAKAPILELLLK